MTDRYVIVIEVDNKRALAAYDKGLEDLNAIWPELMEFAQAKDRKRTEERKAKEAARELEMQRYQNAIDEYCLAKAEFQQWESTSPLWRGARPKVPRYPDYPRLHAYEGMFACYSDEGSYDQMRRSLQRKRDLAAAALAPFKMTENDVASMIDWETGHTVSLIKERMEGNP
ncbi:hypothetical protein [Massilia sp. TN1-12]|uniref:hypothetical protein n=1 Tax=Massilia paldalensis TaxID=3377675 RepID=UPI003850E640